MGLQPVSLFCKKTVSEIANLSFKLLNFITEKRFLFANSYFILCFFFFDECYASASPLMLCFPNCGAASIRRGASRNDAASMASAVLIKGTTGIMHLQCFCDKCVNLRFRNLPDNLVNHNTVLEQDDGRDAAHTITRRS